MEEIGLFPLGMVLLPTERAPLHIFEPRYKELIGECLELDRDFGLVLADDDGIREIGTRAAVTEVLERFDDGRLNVVVEGRDRFRLVELTSGRSFQTGAVEPLVDEDDAPADEQDVARALASFKRLADLAEADVEEPDAADEQLSFVLASRVELSPEIKQQLLQLRSERERLKQLAALLEAAVEAIARERKLAQLASQNGHPRRP